jgi:hypothetical protein
MTADDCWFDHARVRPDKKATLEALIHRVFARRSVAHLRDWQSTWHRKDLIRDIRSQSTQFAAASDPEDGPIPFALGHLRVRDGHLEAVATPLAVEHPEVLTHLLSEFLEPGARVWFRRGATSFGWQVQGAGSIVRIGEGDAAEAT